MEKHAGDDTFSYVNEHLSAAISTFVPAELCLPYAFVGHQMNKYFKGVQCKQPGYKTSKIRSSSLNFIVFEPE